MLTSRPCGLTTNYQVGKENSERKIGKKDSRKAVKARKEQAESVSGAILKVLGKDFRISSILVMEEPSSHASDITGPLCDAKNHDLLVVMQWISGS